MLAAWAAAWRLATPGAPDARRDGLEKSEGAAKTETRERGGAALPEGRGWRRAAGIGSAGPGDPLERPRGDRLGLVSRATAELGTEVDGKGSGLLFAVQRGKRKAMLRARWAWGLPTSDPAGAGTPGADALKGQITCPSSPLVVKTIYSFNEWCQAFLMSLALYVYTHLVFTSR